jgi:hypothetical protein
LLPGLPNLQSTLQKLPSSGPDSTIFLGFWPGTGFALPLTVQAVKKFAARGAMGVIGHPFVPYILVLIGLLRSL